jgi:hypothetical protein
LRVEGEGVPWDAPRSAWRLRELAFLVPEGRALVAPEGLPDRDDVKGAASCGLVLVETDRIEGRAWARLYPVWDRGLLR